MSSCPICASAETHYFGKKNYYIYFQCGNCKLLYLDPIPSDKKIRSLYDVHYDFRVNSLTEKRFREQAVDILNTILKLSPGAKTLLDIGTGYGTFVEIAKRTGFRAIGIESAANLYRAAKRKNANVLHTDFETYFKNNPNKKFDVISLIHVIEHLRDPEKSLRMITKHLKKNGVLFIETPNIDSHLFNVEQADYTFLIPPEHIFLFSQESLKSAIYSVAPGATIFTRTYSYPEHFVGILRRIKNGSFGKKQLVHKPKQKTNGKKHEELPYFDAKIAPKFMTILNFRNKGSILQIYVQLA